MHRSRINGILIDCNVDDIDAAARFWAEALGARSIRTIPARAAIM